MQVPGALEIWIAVEPVAAREHPVFVRCEERLDIVALPDVEAALVALGIRVEGGKEAALRRAHFTERPAGRRDRGLAQHVVTGSDRGLRAKREQGSVVVEHFLEVRNHPEWIDRVPAESAAELVENPAFRHAPQRQDRHGPRLGITLDAQQQLD